MVFSRLAETFTPSDFAYAHRGLWTDDGFSENSLDAFLAAARAGLGIEFDVRPASDGTPIIFHDPTLDRMTDESGAVSARAAVQLVGTPLLGGGTIISLEDLLHAWPQSTPLLCELKIDGQTDAIAFAEAVGTMLSQHSGPAAGMSFSPIAVNALPSDLMRGQLILPSKMSGADDLTKIVPPRVNYLACHVDDVRHASLQAARVMHSLVTWTVKDIDTCKDVAAITDSQIFEGFDPELAKRHILHT